MKKKRIAFLIGSLAGGGAERVVSNLSCSMSDTIEHYIINFNCENAIYPYRGILVKLRPCKDKNVYNPFRKLHYLFTYIYQIWRIKSKYDIKTTISFLTTSNILNVISAGRRKTIISVRSQTSKHMHGFYGVIYSLLIRLLYNRADCIVAVSEGVKDDLIINYRIEPNKIDVIYNPYDLKSIHNRMDEALNIEYFDLFQYEIVLTVGRLTPIKGHTHLIRSFDKVKQSRPNARLVILGAGEYKNELEKLIMHLKLEDYVFLIGFHENPFKYIYNANLFVLSSLSEGFPNALVEAMACGIPVISTDCHSGPREILAPNTDIKKKTDIIDFVQFGVLIPVCNDCSNDMNDPLSKEENLMADSIITMLKDNILREEYSIKGKLRSNDFDLHTILIKWEELIEKHS